MFYGSGTTNRSQKKRENAHSDLIIISYTEKSPFLLQALNTLAHTIGLIKLK